MNKICRYACEHNKSGVCQISVCNKQSYITNNTNDIPIGNIPIETIVKNSLHEADLELKKSKVEREFEQYYINLQKENTNLKQALIDVREYITSHIVYEDLGDGYCYNCDEYEEKEFLQIIDKVLGDEKL